MEKGNRLLKIYRNGGVLIGGCIIIFMQMGSFKVLGVLYEDVVNLYNLSNLHGGWILSFQPSMSYFVGESMRIKSPIYKG